MRFLMVMTCILLAAGSAGAQGVLSDIMSGALINPEVGAFAWYELKDNESGRKLFMRQAIVGEKAVDGKKGYYLETEVVPEIGFPIVYRMLLTGPATSVENIHEIMVREGMNPPENLPVDVLNPGGEDGGEGKRSSVGMEKLATPAGDLEAEHFVIEEGGGKTEVWVNDEIRPMGIVKLVSPEGDLMLTRHGVGGPDGESAMDKKPAEEKSQDVTVRVETSPKKNFTGKKTE